MLCAAAARSIEENYFLLLSPNKQTQIEKLDKTIIAMPAIKELVAFKGRWECFLEVFKKIY